MTNGNLNLDDYFPAGSAEINSIKQSINNQIQSGVLSFNSPFLTLKQLQTIRNQDKKEARKLFWYGQTVTISCSIVAIVVTILVAKIMC